MLAELVIRTVNTIELGLTERIILIVFAVIALFFVCVLREHP